MNRWLNFREIKQSIPIEAVLGHYQWKYLRRRGDRGAGMLPDSPRAADGCFQCGSAQ